MFAIPARRKARPFKSIYGDDAGDVWYALAFQEKEFVVSLKARSVCIISTGGTIDKVHDKFAESLGFDPGRPPAAEVITEAASVTVRSTVRAFQYDSFDLTDELRVELADHVQNTSCDAVVITHGTSTMGETARYLDGRNMEKTVVLTGSMRPHAFAHPEAAFNLGGAVIAARTLPYGVYGVMNGHVFPANLLTKDEKKGRFDASVRYGASD